MTSPPWCCIWRSTAQTPAVTGESAADVYTLTVGAENTVTDACYAKASWTDRLYTIASEDLVNLCRTPRQLYEEQAITSLEEDDLTAMTVELPGETLDFRYDADAGAWTLADDPDYALDQNIVTKMAGDRLCAQEPVEHHRPAGGQRLRP